MQPDQDIPAGLTVGGVLCLVTRHPWTYVARRWNYKSAASCVTARFFKLYDQLHRRRPASPANPAPMALQFVRQTTPDFALSTTASHRIVTALGHSALQESEVTE